MGNHFEKGWFKEIAPVYDNGNCVNNKWDDAKMQIVMGDVDKMEAEAYKARRCIFELHGKLCSVVPGSDTADVEQKGYAVSSMLYPVVMIVMSPVAAFLYEKLAMEQILVSLCWAF